MKTFPLGKTLSRLLPLKKTPKRCPFTLEKVPIQGQPYSDTRPEQKSAQGQTVARDFEIVMPVAPTHNAPSP